MLDDAHTRRRTTHQRRTKYGRFPATGKPVRPNAQMQQVAADAAQRSGRTVLDPIRPNAALRAAYDKRLQTMAGQMVTGMLATVTKAYAGEEDRIVATDASPATILAKAMDAFASDWLRRLNIAGMDLAKWFATSVADRTDAQLTASMRRNGFTVRFRLTAAERDAIAATVQENVTYIKSIASEYLTQAQGAVMRGVVAGRDLQATTDDLLKIEGVTRRRAARIALDQNNKATAMLARTRMLELGVTKAIWLHSAGGKTPRPSHVEFNGKEYDVANGVTLDPAEGKVWPGTAINCRCVPRPIVPGFDD